MKHVSILIPTYNDPCVTLVTTLQQQAQAAGATYEIIVGDDGSTRADVLQQNRAVNELPNCRMTEREANAGRAAIRNFLAGQARNEWLLFIDSDMVVCRADFLNKYLQTSENEMVVDGGVVIRDTIEGNLRSLYEKAAEPHHTAQCRQLTPYQHLHTANLFIRRDIFLNNPFDERFRHYGYEDVLLGKQLQVAGIPVSHIDNPMSFEVFETNLQFVQKTEEGLRTLHQFQAELQGYSSLLSLANRLRHLAPLVRLWHRLNNRWERRQLTGSHPSLTVFNLYRLGYFMTL